MDKKDVEMLMGDGDGQAGIFTWREKNRKKVCGSHIVFHFRAVVNPHVRVAPQLAYSM